MTRQEALIALGFEPDANPSEREVKDAYRKASKLYHPDSGSGQTNSAEFDRIATASVLLKNGAIPDEVRTLAKKHIDWAIEQIVNNRIAALSSPAGVTPRASSALSHFRRLGDALDHVLVLLRSDCDRYQRDYAKQVLNIETFRHILAQLDMEPNTHFNSLAREQLLARVKVAESDMALYIKSNNITQAVIELVEAHRQELAPTHNPYAPQPSYR